MGLKQPWKNANRADYSVEQDERHKLFC